MEAIPPKVITVDTDKGEAQPQDVNVASGGDMPSTNSLARTPKHANRTKDEGESGASRSAGHASQYPPGYHPHPPQRPARLFNGNGAFQPRDPHPRQHYTGPPQRPGRHYSHGGLQEQRYYDGPPRYGDYQQSVEQGRYGNARGGGDHGRYGTHAGGDARHSYGRGGMYPPAPPQQGYYEGGNAGPSWGHPPYGRPPQFQMQQQLDPYARGPHHTSNSTFSRAVSSSFDRSVKSRTSLEERNPMEPSSYRNPIALPRDANDNASIADDASWGQLNQVTSVDEEELRKRLKRDTATSEGIQKLALNDHRPSSNSSSLTNSPTEGVKKSESVDRKLTSSLDSLSSVASVQEPMETDKEKTSPAESTSSLDLMKCPSGSSALLSPSDQREFSQLSFNLSSKKSTEEREDLIEKDGDGTLRIGSTEPPTKKLRTGKKASPLSITCSPPLSPTERRTESSKPIQPQPIYASQQAPDSYYEKLSSYSMDSVPPLPGSRYLPPRPASSASSTMTPVDNHGPPAVQQLPSWDIYPQDSFGAGSLSGGMGPSLGANFSFSQDYPMLSASASNDHGGNNHPLESRNQSFDAAGNGHFFQRSDSMVSYEGARQGGYEPRQQYVGPFPPQAPSWGSATSFHQQQQHGFPYPNRQGSFGGPVAPPMRSFPVGNTGRPFQPPPEFRAPPSMVQKANQNNTTLMSSNYVPHENSKNGPFGWSKEEDMRLSEVMKKYKNPRDWEPIAKELNRGRSAKECHERWIRYLKPGVRKGQWTDAEDAIVMDAVNSSSEQPFTRWSDLAQRLPGRVGKQIRDRWVNHLNPNINHLPFSREDDLLLWNGHKKLGKRWVEIATKFFNSSRSENHIKNRWYSASFKKFIANEFGPDAYAGTKSPKKASSTSKRSRPSDDASEMTAV